MELLTAHSRQRLHSLLFAFMLLPALGCQQQRELAPGQVWSYDTRSGEGASTIQILHIERGTPLGDVYFVSVRALNVKRSGKGIQTTVVWPLVFTHDALTASLGTFQWSEKVDRPYVDELELWLREAREGRAAEHTFTVPIKNALQEIKLDQPDADKRDSTKD